MSSAISRAAALLGGDGSKLVGSFQAGSALMQLAIYHSYEEAEAAHIALNRITLGATGWVPGDDRKVATGAVTRAAAQALMANYAAGVEMLGFTSTLPSLLEPDHIARLISRAPNVDCAYAPIRYPARLTLTLQKMIGHYPVNRRLKLLENLWDTAHERGWWDGAKLTRKPRRRRRDLIIDYSEAVERDLSDAEVVETFTSGLFHPSPELEDRLRSITLPELGPKVGRAVAANKLTLELEEIAARLPQLSPAERPPSPIEMLVDALAAEYVDAEQPMEELLPEKPKEWMELYPEAGYRKFTFPKVVWAWHDAALPGHPDSRVQVIRNMNALKRNADYMGNCTHSLHGNAVESGREVIFILHFEGRIFNGAFYLPDFRLVQVEGRVRDHNRAWANQGLERVQAAFVEMGRLMARGIGPDGNPVRD